MLAAAEAIHGFVRLAFGFFLALGFAAVVKLFAFGDGQLAFSDAIAKINLERNNGHALLLRLDEEFLDFSPIQEQLPLAKGIVIARAARLIFRNVTIHEPRFACAELGVGVSKGPLALAKRFNFRADEHESRFQFVEKVVIVRGGTVLRDNFYAFTIRFFCGGFHDWL